MVFLGSEKLNFNDYFKWVQQTVQRPETHPIQLGKFVHTPLIGICGTIFPSANGVHQALWIRKLFSQLMTTYWYRYKSPGWEIEPMIYNISDPGLSDWGSFFKTRELKNSKFFKVKGQKTMIIPKTQRFLSLNENLWEFWINKSSFMKL
jgi:hypothetical protein